VEDRTNIRPYFFVLRGLRNYGFVFRYLKDCDFVLRYLQHKTKHLLLKEGERGDEVVVSCFATETKDLKRKGGEDGDEATVVFRRTDEAPNAKGRQRRRSS